MKKSFSKKMIVGAVLILLFVCCGCSSLLGGDTNVNNVVINKTVEYEEVDISSLQSGMQMAIEKAENSSIAITHEEGVILTSSALGSGVVVKRTANLINPSLGEVSGNISSYTYYAVTNRHVILTTRNVISSTLVVYVDVKNPIENSPTSKAKVVAISLDDDLALIEFTSPYYLGVAKFADSSKLKKGAIVLAIGTPYSLEYFRSSTMGIVSSPLRPITEEVYEKSYANKYEVSGTKQMYFIQHDAAINGGNSGGGLFDINGDLIGINTSKLVDESKSIEGMAFSIPSNTVYTKFAEYLK